MSNEGTQSRSIEIWMIASSRLPRGVTVSTSGSDPGDGGSTPPGAFSFFFASRLDIAHWVSQRKLLQYSSPHPAHRVEPLAEDLSDSMEVVRVGKVTSSKEFVVEFFFVTPFVVRVVHFPWTTNAHDADDYADLHRDQGTIRPTCALRPTGWTDVDLEGQAAICTSWHAYRLMIDKCDPRGLHPSDLHRDIRTSTIRPTCALRPAGWMDQDLASQKATCFVARLLLRFLAFGAASLYEPH